MIFEDSDFHNLCLFLKLIWQDYITFWEKLFQSAI